MPLDSLPVDHLFTMSLTADFGGASAIKGGPSGTRNVVGVTDGTFEGPRLRGTIVPPSGDWVTARSGGVLKVDVRLMLATDDGARILMQYTGIGRRGDAGIDLRTAPLFETGDERYAWLNDVQAVGVGTSDRSGVRYEVYALR
jgi:hypothetical protein